MAVQVVPRRFSVDEYHLMARAGILHKDDRVELLEGEIGEMAPSGSRRAACVDRLTRVLSEGLGRSAIVRVQGPIRLGEHSEPQPDITLLKPQDDFYADATPGPEAVLLLIEVSETTQEYDRQVKLPLYAKWGVPEVWLVDLQGPPHSRIPGLGSRWLPKGTGSGGGPIPVPIGLSGLRAGRGRRYPLTGPSRFGRGCISRRT